VPPGPRAPPWKGCLVYIYTTNAPSPAALRPRRLPLAGSPKAGLPSSCALIPLMRTPRSAGLWVPGAPATPNNPIRRSGCLLRAGGVISISWGARWTPHVRKCHHQMSSKEHIQLGWVVRWVLSTPPDHPAAGRWRVRVVHCRTSTSLLLCTRPARARPSIGGQSPTPAPRQLPWSPPRPDALAGYRPP
jgi:hypothetical protein